MPTVRLALAAAAVVLLGAAAGAPVALAGEPLAATTCRGVWVVVGAELSCAPTHPSGEAALESAGHDVLRSGGLVCRIDGVPDVCAPTFEAYWSYWQAERLPDGSYGPWRYATTGPATYVPVAGNAEGWVFGDGDQAPTILPPASSPVPGAGDRPGAEPSDGEPTRDALVAAPTAVTLATLVAGGSALTVAARRRGR